MNKNLWLAIGAVCFGMAVTSGLVALATAAPAPPSDRSAVVEQHLDELIAMQLTSVKQHLHVHD
jgi:hypothetical protein